MYGLINQAVKEMVLTQHGDIMWESIRAQAGVNDIFISMDQYPEQVTDRLVMAASALLGVSSNDILIKFGHYWVGFAHRNYDYVLAMSGKNFLEFVKNLNNMHVRVGQWMPDLKPPSFTVSGESKGCFMLHYYSTRSGFAPMVTGLLAGLGERFHTDVDVVHIRGAAQGLDHEQFQVRYRPRLPALAPLNG